jgi:hypothetical protein
MMIFERGLEFLIYQLVMIGTNASTTCLTFPTTQLTFDLEIYSFPTYNLFLTLDKVSKYNKFETLFAL